ncbi:MAG: ABC transporter transmembrane domain-containing protein, partial [Actinomycetota bacterium]|nr:ABC transporter transmembrane domain-containing protein [Actinomycetota bacterium]
MLPRPLSRSRLPLFSALVGIGIGQAVGAITVALLVERGFDLFITGTAPVDARVAGWLGAGLLGGVALTAALRGQERVVAERVGQHYILDVRETLFKHLTRVPARDLGQRSRGSMLLRFVGDLKALKAWVSLGLARMIVGGLAVGLAMTALAVINLRLGLAVGLVLVLGALATWATSPRLLATSRKARSRQSKLTGEVSERLSQIAVLQASGQERRERKRVKRKSDHVAVAMIARARASGNTRAVAEATAALAGVAALVVGAMEVRAGRATAGTVVASLSIAGLLSGHLRDLGRVAEYAAVAKVARQAVQ